MPAAEKPLALVESLGRNSCVATTAREGADRGCLVTLVEQACSTTHPDLYQATMRNFQRLLGRVAATRAALVELPKPASEGGRA